MFEFSATPDRSGMIIADGAVNAARTQARATEKMWGDVSAGLQMFGATLAEAGTDKRKQKEGFEGVFSWLSDKNFLPQSAQTAAQDLAKRGDYAAANARIAPYLAELDFGRRAYMAGREGYFAGGAWQPIAETPDARQRNREGYKVSF